MYNRNKKDNYRKKIEELIEGKGKQKHSRKTLLVAAIGKFFRVQICGNLQNLQISAFF
jgi:hypothetical protein